MAGNRFKATKSGITTGTSAKTLLQVIAATNHKVLIDELSVSFNGTSNTAAPILVQVIRQTSAGTMTSLTGVKDPDDFDETLQTTFQHTASAEPTSGDVLFEEYVHPQTGYTWQAGFGRAIQVGGGDRVGVVVTAGASVSATARVAGEE